MSKGYETVKEMNVFMKNQINAISKKGFETQTVYYGTERKLFFLF